MRRLLAVLALSALPTASTQLGCSSGSTEPRCAQPGESCLTKNCCPKPDGSFSYTVEFVYPNGVQTVSACTCD